MIPGFFTHILQSSVFEESKTEYVTYIYLSLSSNKDFVCFFYYLFHAFYQQCFSYVGG